MAKEILVAGGGVAGLRAAGSLAEGGNRVTLVEPEPVRSTRSWFVACDLLPPDIKGLVNAGKLSVSRLKGIQFLIFQGRELLEEFGISLEGIFNQNSFLMVNQPELENYLKTRAENCGAKISEDTVVGISPQDGFLEVRLKDSLAVKAEVVIDATGPASCLHRLRSVGPAIDDDPYVLWVSGARMEGEFNPDIMLFPLHPEIGRLNWITPWSEKEADVLAADYCRLSEFEGLRSKFRARFKRLIKLCLDQGICCPRLEKEPIVGMIRTLPTRRPVHSFSLFAIGEAAGQSCPNMCEGVTRAIDGADKFARLVSEKDFLSPSDYHRFWRDKGNFPYHLALAFMVKRLASGKVGGNADFYQAILKEKPDTQIRLMLERKLRLADLPGLIIEAGLHPTIFFSLLELLQKMILLKYPPYVRKLYAC